MKDSFEWSVRDGNEEDMERILSLREIVFGETEKDRKDPRFWRWQFMEGPDGKAFIYLVEKEGRVIGHLADHPRQFSIHGELVSGVFHLELMVHPEDWRKGIFQAMEKYSIQRMEKENKLLMTACTIRRESINGLKKVGWKAITEFPVLVYPIRFQGILNRYLHFPPLSFLLGGIARFFYTLFFWKKKGNEAGEIEVEEISKLDNNFDPFWEKTSSLFPLLGVRDRTFLNWRYLQHPTRRYIFYRMMNHGEMRGYIVLRKVDLLNFNSVAIVDLLALDEEALIGLVAKGIEFAQEGGADLLGIMIPKEHPYGGLLRRKGFLPSLKTFSFLIYPHLHKAFLLLPEKWHFNWGDTDVL